MDQVVAERGIAAAERFVQKLAALDPALLRPALPPVPHRDPYLSAWTNIEVALGNAPPDARDRLLTVAAELDRRIDRLPLAPEIAAAARRAVRAILARPIVGTPASVGLVYEPFASLIPLETLD